MANRVVRNTLIRRGAVPAQRLAYRRGGIANVAPAASFTSIRTLLSLAFTDTSTDGDGSIVSWAWDFGDGATSTAQNPTHAYTTVGNKTVTLTVTDNLGATNTVTGTVSPDITRDGPSSVRVPLTTADWTALGLPAPLYFWPLQEASGDLIATIGTQTLTSSGGNQTGKLYQQTLTGWTRKAIGMSATVGQKGWYSTDATWTPALNESYAVLLYAGGLLAAAQAEYIWVFGGSDYGVKVTSAAGPKYGYTIRSAGGGESTPGVDHGTNPALIRPILAGRNCAASTAKVFTNLEVASGTYNGAAPASNTKGIYTFNNQMPDANWVFAAVWKGTDAETILAKTTLTTLGWSIPY